MVPVRTTKFLISSFIDHSGQKDGQCITRSPLFMTIFDMIVKGEREKVEHGDSVAGAMTALSNMGHNVRRPTATTVLFEADL